MRNEAPTEFDLESFYDGVYLFQTWEIFPGFRTPGLKDVAAHLDCLHFPADLSGKRVLEIAPWNGFFSFECARRGASEVVALGPEDPADTGFERTRHLLEMDQVRYVQGSVYDVDEGKLGTFDVVLALGLLYHLRHPLLALDRLYDVCRDRFFVDTPVIDHCIFDRTISDELRQEISASGSAVHQLPLVYYTGANETGDPYNWFMPNLRAFRSMTESSGFMVDHAEYDGGQWAWIAATKGDRPFTEGLEGYNPLAASAR